MARLSFHSTGIMPKYQLFLLQAVYGTQLISQASATGFESVAKAWSTARATTGGFYPLRCADDTRCWEYRVRAKVRRQGGALAEGMVL